LTAEQIAEVLFSGARIYHVEVVAEVAPLCERPESGGRSYLNKRRHLPTAFFHFFLFSFLLWSYLHEAL
jgi:hypothetical protein